MATKPPCGCCRKNFEFVSFEHTGDGFYRLVFNACNVYPLILQVSQDCTVWFAGTVYPSSGTVEGVNLSHVPDGVYTAKGSSPNCDGFAEFEFRVVHNGTIPAEEYELEAPELSATGIDATSIRIGWTHEGSVDDYKLQILDVDTWSDLATISASSRSYDIGELEEDIEVTVRLGARKGTNILWSNLAKATPLGECNETLDNSSKNTFDSFVTTNSSTYGGNFIGEVYRNERLWEKHIGTYGENTPIHVASLSKQFAAAVILILVEEGVFTAGLDTTVGSLIPSFAAAGKGAIKLRHLMSHTSGMKAVSTQGYEDQSGLTSQEAVDLIAANVPLEHTPGTYYEYGGVHWCIAARMAEVATGQKWVQLCQAKIWEPLGMNNTSYWVDPFPPTDNPMIHAGLITTLSDFGKFMQMRLKFGMYGSVRILSQVSVMSMEADQTGEAIEIAGNLTVNPVYGFGVFPGDGVENFHDGATGCVAWINREKKYYGLIFTNVTGSEAREKNDEFRALIRSEITEAPDCSKTEPAIIEDFIFLTNTTGYFDSDDFISKIRGLALASNEIRWCVRWDEYETSPGVYATEKLANRMAQIDAIYVAKGRNRPRYSIDFWGVRHDGKIEQFIPADDVVVFQGGKRAVGDLVINKCYGLGSFSSEAYHNRINACAYSIVKWFAENAPGRMNYISLSCGQTEEFFNYLWDDPERPNHYESHGDFSPTAVTAWRNYLRDTYGNTTPWGENSNSSNIPFADWEGQGVWGVAYMVATQKGTAWAKFTNREMERTVIEFRNAAKSANSQVNVIHFVADFYRAQSNGWYGNSPSNYPIIAQVDGFYHSDGDMGADGDWAKKYSAFDCLVPTFGANKHYYCELDYVDMYMFRMDPGHWGEVSTSVMPDKNAIKRVCRSVYRKGGRGIHFAMSMTEAQAEVAAEACLEFLEEVRNGTVTRLDRSSAPNYNFELAPMVFGQGENLLNFYKTTAGGTEENVVNIKLLNNV